MFPPKLLTRVTCKGDEVDILSLFIFHKIFIFYMLVCIDYKQGPLQDLLPH